MTLDEEITELTQRYYVLVNRDHHKDRDCHFYIEKVWSYGDPPYYVIRHYGYINELKNDQHYKTAEAATIMLRDYLKRIVAKEESYDPGRWDFEDNY